MIFFAGGEKCIKNYIDNKSCQNNHWSATCSAYVSRCTGLYMIIYGVRQVRACELSRYITGNVYLYIALCTESFWVNDLYEAQASRSRVTCFDIVFHCLLVDNDRPQGKITTDTFIGPVHTNAFSKVCVFISLKTQWKSCVHFIFVSYRFTRPHGNNENAINLLLRMCRRRYLTLWT